MQWIPEQIVVIGEDFHSQVHDVKVKTTPYKVGWRGYDRTGNTWEPIIHLQGHVRMVKSTDRRREAESKETHSLKNTLSCA
jgi:hypothetical protein